MLLERPNSAVDRACEESSLTDESHDGGLPKVAFNAVSGSLVRLASNELSTDPPSNDKESNITQRDETECEAFNASTSKRRSLTRPGCHS